MEANQQNYTGVMHSDVMAGNPQPAQRAPSYQYQSTTGVSALGLTKKSPRLEFVNQLGGTRLPFLGLLIFANLLFMTLGLVMCLGAGGTSQGAGPNGNSKDSKYGIFICPLALLVAWGLAFLGRMEDEGQLPVQVLPPKMASFVVVGGIGLKLLGSFLLMAKILTDAKEAGGAFVAGCVFLGLGSLFANALQPVFVAGKFQNYLALAHGPIVFIGWSVVAAAPRKVSAMSDVEAMSGHFKGGGAMLFIGYAMAVGAAVWALVAPSKSEESEPLNP